jgi:hypothetical protein
MIPADSRQQGLLRSSITSTAAECLNDVASITLRVGGSLLNLSCIASALVGNTVLLNYRAAGVRHAVANPAIAEVDSNGVTRGRLVDCCLLNCEETLLHTGSLSGGLLSADDM